MSAIEIHISAENLVHHHGRQAWAYAVDHAEASAAAGDWRRVAEWRRIGGAIRALERRPLPATKGLGLLGNLTDRVMRGIPGSNQSGKPVLS